MGYVDIKLEKAEVRKRKAIGQGGRLGSAGYWYVEIGVDVFGNGRGWIGMGEVRWIGQETEGCNEMCSERCRG